MQDNIKEKSLSEEAQKLIENNQFRSEAYHRIEDWMKEKYDKDMEEIKAIVVQVSKKAARKTDKMKEELYNVKVVCDELQYKVHSLDEVSKKEDKELRKELKNFKDDIKEIKKEVKQIQEILTEIAIANGAVEGGDSFNKVRKAYLKAGRKYGKNRSFGATQIRTDKNGFDPFDLGA